MGDYMDDISIAISVMVLGAVLIGVGLHPPDALIDLTQSDTTTEILTCTVNLTENQMVTVEDETYAFVKVESCDNHPVNNINYWIVGTKLSGLVILVFGFSWLIYIIRPAGPWRDQEGR